MSVFLHCHPVLIATKLLWQCKSGLQVWKSLLHQIALLRDVTTNQWLRVWQFSNCGPWWQLNKHAYICQEGYKIVTWKHKPIVLCYTVCYQKSFATRWSEKKYTVGTYLKEANTMFSTFRTDEKRRVSEEHTTITFGDVRHKFLATQLLQIVLCCVTFLIKNVFSFDVSLKHWH